MVFVSILVDTRPKLNVQKTLTWRSRRHYERFVYIQFRLCVNWGIDDFNQVFVDTGSFPRSKISNSQLKWDFDQNYLPLFQCHRTKKSLWRTQTKLYLTLYMLNQLNHTYISSYDTKIEFFLMWCKWVKNN